jgi:lysophospholipase L1-like esterase
MSLADIQSMKALKIAKQNLSSLVALSSQLTNYKVSLKATGSNTYAYACFGFDANGLGLTNGATINVIASINTSENGVSVAVKSFQAQTLSWTDFGTSDTVENGLQTLTTNTALNVNLSLGRDNTKRYVKIYFMFKNLDTVTLKNFFMSGIKCTINNIALPIVANGVYIASGDSANTTTPSSQNTVSPRWSGKNANFMGDSITYGAWSADGGTTWTTVTPYHQYLKDTLGLSTVRNYGVSSTAISTKADYPDSTNAFVNRYSAMDNNADLIAVLGGTNDFGHNTPLGTIADKTDISFYGALNVLMSGLIAKYLGKRIIFMTPLHRNLSGDNNETNALGVKLSQYVQAIKDVAQYYGIPVIDLYNISGLNPSVSIIKTTYMDDGLHPNAAGHQLLANNISGQFNAL